MFTFSANASANDCLSFSDLHSFIFGKRSKISKDAQVEIKERPLMIYEKLANGFWKMVGTTNPSLKDCVGHVFSLGNFKKNQWNALIGFSADDDEGRYDFRTSSVTGVHTEEDGSVIVYTKHSVYRFAPVD